MKKDEFSDKSPGKVVQIPHPHSPTQFDWAFVPIELPAPWTIEADLWPLITKAAEAVSELNGIGKVLQNPELLMRPLQDREAISSSGIEGTYVTPQEFLLFRLEPEESRPRGGKAALQREVSNYADALRTGYNMLRGESLPPCHRIIKSMHHRLMSDIPGGSTSTPGKYRTEQVQIGKTSARFIPPPAAHVNPLMDNFEKYINDGTGSSHPLVRTFIAHYQFETIHPFFDGNGRIGRALISLLLCHWMNHSMPWLYLSPYFEKHKEEYIQRLFNVSTKGEWREWIIFCLNGTIVQAKDAVKRCEKFRELLIRFKNRIGSNGTSRSHTIIEKLFNFPCLKVASLSEKLDISYNSAKKDVEILTAAGILKEMDGVYPKTFFSPEIVDVAFADYPDELLNDSKPDTEHKEDLSSQFRHFDSE